MVLYGERDDAGRPLLEIAMPRSPRLYAPGGTMHVIQGTLLKVLKIRKAKDIRCDLSGQRWVSISV